MKLFGWILKQVQHVVQVNFLPHVELVFGPGQIVEQEFQDQGAAQAAAFDLEIGKAMGR